MHHSSRTFTMLTAGYGFVLPWNWAGSVSLGRRALPLGSGEIFCADPGESLRLSPSEAQAGTFKLLDILPRTFDALCRSEGAESTLSLPAVVLTPGSSIARAVRRVMDAISFQATSMEVQAWLTALARACVLEWSAPLSRRQDRLPALGTFARLRDLLHGEDASRLDLNAFAAEAGVSHYQLSRGFKRIYGVPPHAYELQLRVERARSMLRHGYSVAEAAQAQSFADSSHLIRHFRRIWGLTPGQYARPELPNEAACALSATRDETRQLLVQAER